jgi:hypothetical protein
VLGEVVTQSTNAAQVFFLIALILGAIVTVWQLVTGAVQGAVLSAALTFVAVGLLFLS